MALVRSPILPPVPPGVCYLFEKLTLDLHAKGWSHYSARAVLHRIRWHHHVDMGDRTFKANNNWTPALSRWVMLLHPEIGEFFETRASPSPHDMTDYMGPYHGRSRPQARLG
jgi:hypothetical protein